MKRRASFYGVTNYRGQVSYSRVNELVCGDRQSCAGAVTTLASSFAKRGRGPGRQTCAYQKHRTYCVN